MKISIIIPTLGRETLKQVIPAIESGTDFEFIKPEVLVVFDGTLDATLVGKVQRKIRKKHVGLFRFLETKKKMGASGARNLGIKKATGSVLVFLGDDTIPTKNWLKKIDKWHQKNAQKECVLLGKVAWVPSLGKDAFHRWLLGHAQFDFDRLDRGKKPSWQHFYTSNISVKKALLEKSPAPLFQRGSI